MVLPCVPATAMPYFRRISSASISARRTTVMPRRARRARPRGCPSATAEETTTRSTPSRWSGEWPERDRDAELARAARSPRSPRWSQPETVEVVLRAAPRRCRSCRRRRCRRSGRVPRGRRSGWNIIAAAPGVRRPRRARPRRSAIAAAAPGRARRARRAGPSPASAARDRRAARRAASASRSAVELGSVEQHAPRPASRAPRRCPPGGRRRARAAEERRPAGGADLGEGDGAGARDDQVGRAPSPPATSSRNGTTSTRGAPTPRRARRRARVSSRCALAA